MEVLGCTSDTELPKHCGFHLGHLLSLTQEKPTAILWAALWERPKRQESDVSSQQLSRMWGRPITTWLSLEEKTALANNLITGFVKDPEPDPSR